jgi:soluble lytic murein transglycosylase-like protein
MHARTANHRWQPRRWEAAHRVAALSPTALPRSQTAIAEWLARRYKVAPEAVARIVQEAWLLGDRSRIDPTLILAVVAVESGLQSVRAQPHGRARPDAGDDPRAR